MKPSENHPPSHSLAVVGRGRVGGAIARKLGLRDVHGRGFDGLGEGRPYQAVLLCVPDSEIAAAAAAIAPGPLVGHCSGATGLEALAPHECFSLHPLSTLTGPGSDFAGAAAALDGSSERARDYASALALELGLRPFAIAAGDRAAYHAAASMASNFLITLEAAAERLAATAGVTRDQLLPLVSATVENWGRLGPRAALTGPVARGDHETVERQRRAVCERAPELAELFDALTLATRALAAR